MTVLENLASKKFGIMLAVIYVLWDASQKQPDKALIYLSMMCGMAVFYTVCTIWQDYTMADKPTDPITQTEAKDGLSNTQKP